jgi:DNA relaxase NicK
VDDTTHPNVCSNTIMESQIDWVTWSVEGEQKCGRLQAWAYSKARAEERAGNKETPFRLMGYDGFAVGRVRFGIREDRALCQLSGQLAEDHLVVATTQADRLTRLDIAVTVRLAEPDANLGRATYAEAVAWRESHPAAAVPWIVQDAKGGCTTYIGRRTSDSFFRLYNKEAESKEAKDTEAVARYRDCWRYELECKGALAKALAYRAADSRDRHAWCQSAVHEYVSRHGVSAAFPSDGARVLVSGFRRRADRHSKLTWLTKSVKPAVLWLLADGEPAEVMEALGLSPEREGESDEHTLSDTRLGRSESRRLAEIDARLDLAQHERGSERRGDGVRWER